jgi:hypothetical protein
VAASKSLRKRIEDDIDNITEIVGSVEQQKKQEEEYKNSLSANNVYEVTVPGSKVAIPPLCTCCLKEADSQQSVSYSWTEHKTFSKVERSVSLNFPICRECKKHQSELSTMRFFLIIFASGVSIALLYLLGLASGPFKYDHHIGIGGVILLVSLFALSSLLRVRVLPEEHAARNDAVSMTDASANYGYATFRFSNYLYAFAFAQANNREVKKKRFLKYSRKTSLLRGRSAYHVIAWVTVLGFVGHSIAYSVLDDKWHSNSSYRTSAYTTKPRITYDKPGYDYSESGSSLLTQINQGKNHLREMESQLQIMSSELENLSKRIEVLKKDIEVYENAAAISTHNMLVEQHNSVSGQYQIRYSAYKSELERVNNMINRYNRRY